MRIYHHELHKKKIKRSTILKLQTKDGLLEGHSKVSAYLEGLVGDLLSSHPNLCEASQASLLGEALPVFTEQDSNMFRKLPTKQEVKGRGEVMSHLATWSSNPVTRAILFSKLKLSL